MSGITTPQVILTGHGALDGSDMDFLHVASLFLITLLLYLDIISAYPARRQYGRSELLQLNFVRLAGVSDITPQIPDLIRRCPGNIYEETGVKRRRKRGKRGGARLRLRKTRFNRLPLPSMILGNVQSIRNKLDELQGNVRFLKDYKDCCVMAFTETWLTERDQDSDLMITGFGAPHRVDRNSEVTNKTQGGGVCLYINQRYCTSVTVRERICTPDVELLSVSLRPFYLPREFPQLFITVVYIHPRAHAPSACKTVYDVVQKLQSISPEAPAFILGDFNHVSLKKSVPYFHQYVTCPTRRDKTLDLCYGSVKEAYKSLPLPSLGHGDHNCVYLMPTYRTVLKREKVSTKDIKDWTEESVQCLKACFDCTNWDMFIEASGEDLDQLVDVICSYVTFCRDMIIPCKRVKMYSNNKPWVTKSVKASIQAKKYAFKHGTASDLHTATKDLKIEILRAKKDYKTILENKMAANNLGSAWSSMKSIAGISNSKTISTVILKNFDSDPDLANVLNRFFSRFDTHDFSTEIQELRHNLADQNHFAIDEGNVEKALSSINANKSCGPDNICGRLLKFCSKELCTIFHYIFNKSLQIQHVPKCWKDAVVVPAPKTRCPKVQNDFRPIALTSLVMKTFEKLVRNEIVKKTQSDIDQFQFAYRPHRGVEDATVTMINMLCKHLGGKGTHAQLLFVDFSSAFNTIQPHILTERLLEQFDLSKNLVGWVLDFLTNRTQRVRVNGVLSDQICSSTGSPQGCVLSPLLFILYTNMCRSSREDRFILKYADDSVIVSLLQGNETGHGPVVQDFVDWCERSFLQMNISKTKNMYVDFRKLPRAKEPTSINGQIVECVDNYKYLGTIIDSKLSFEANCEAVYKKANQRLHCLRKLSSFHIDRKMLTMFYRCFIESVLSFSLVSWFSNLPLKNKNSLNQIVRWASRLIGEPQLNLETLYIRQLQRLAGVHPRRWIPPTTW